MPLNSFIPVINAELAKQFPKDARFYGVAQSIPRIRGSVSETIPGVVDRNGDIEYVGIDDKYSLQVYHKLTLITVERTTTTGGYGDDLSDTKNTYALSAYVYHDVKRTAATSDIFLRLQNQFPQTLAAHPYKSIYVRLASVILNSDTLFAQEYKGSAFKLPPTGILFQLNYTIESSFERGCFEKLCPEDIC